MNAIAIPAGEVSRVELVAFTTRNEAWLGEEFRPPPTEESWEEILSDRTQRWYAIVGGQRGAAGSEQPASTSDEFSIGVLGMAVLSRMTPSPWRSAEIGFAVDSTLAGRGLVQASVPQLIDSLLSNELARIEARVDPSNCAAAISLHRLGFQFEGNARGCIDRRGGRRTQEQWAIIAADRVEAGPCVSGSTGSSGSGPERPIEARHG